MNYFNLFKFSALEKDWYTNFNDHISKTVNFLFQDEIELSSPIEFDDTLESFPNHFGPCILFASFTCQRTNRPLPHDYEVHLSLRFKRWENSVRFLNLPDDQKQGYVIKQPADLDYAICRIEKVKVVDGHKFQRKLALKTFQPNHTTPYTLLSFVKNAILNDRIDDDFNSDDEQPDQPSPYLDSPKNLQRA